MNNKTGKSKEVLVDLKQVFWDVLSQWKLVLIVALAMSALVCVVKYRMDQAAYLAKINENSNTSDSAVESIEVKNIENLLRAMPDKDKEAAMYLADLQKEVLQQQSYLSGSILINATPSNQRTLVLSYYLKTTAGMDIQAISESYITSLNDNRLHSKLCELIQPGADSKYIAELITATSSTLPDSEMTGQLLNVKVVLPHEADASAVESVITDTFNEKNKSLVSIMGEHTIRLTNSSEIFKCATDVLDKKAAMYGSMNGSQNNIKTFYQQLSDEQKAVVDYITNQNRAVYLLSDSDMLKTEISDETEIPDETELIEKAHFKPVFAIVGFILGVILYVFVYLLVIILRGKLVTADNAGLYTNSRLLGVIINSNKKYTGMKALTHSSLIDRIHYRGVDSVEKQLEKVVSKIQAVSNHINAADVSIVCLTERGNETKRMAERIRQAVAEKGLKVDFCVYNADINENDLLDVHNAVSIVDGDSRPCNITQMLHLYDEYGINQMGCVFVEGV